MGNKKMGKVIQMLSPENYIKRKARELPIHECLINLNWNKTKIANIAVARKHTNGNITAGLYLVDLACLGVKDSFWFFNIPEDDYLEKLEKFQGLGAKKIDYQLAHNIIFAAIEFADDYGFKPHKDFTSLTRFILEEDNDKVPLIDIECGVDGMPAIIKGPYDDEKSMNKYIAQLEREAGPGNYLIIDERGNFMNDSDDDDQYNDATLEEKCKLFFNYYKNYEHLIEEEIESFLELVDDLVVELTDQESTDQHYDDLLAIILSVEVESSFIPDEMLGAEPGQVDVAVKEQFVELMEAVGDLKHFKSLLKQFEKNNGVDAAIGFAWLVYYTLKHPKRFEKELVIFVGKHPDYALGKIKKAKHELIGEDPDKTNNVLHKPSFFFGSRKQLHELEYFVYLDYLTHLILSLKDFSKLRAWKDILIEIDEDGKFESLLNLITIFQIEIISGYFSE